MGKKYRQYSQEELAFVKDNQKLSMQELHRQFTSQFDRPNTSVKALASLRLRQGWVDPATRGFKPGNQKYKDREPGCLTEAWLKKKPIGSETVSVKDGIPYTRIKVASNVWKYKHIWIWENEHGPLGKNMQLSFKDGDTTNITLDNLVLMTKAETVALNRLGGRTIPAELRPTAILLTKVQVKLKDLSNEISSTGDGNTSDSIPNNS